MSELLAIALYFVFLFFYATAKRKKNLTQSDFVIGSRSLDQWTTAFAAHASDMSSWLFIAYPSMIFIHGGSHIWTAIGLFLMMWVNWTFIAPKVRSQTEKSKSVTITGFFEKKIGKSWPQGRITTSAFLYLFYTIYIASALNGMGLLVETLFPLSYTVGVLLGVALILTLVLIGGYMTLAKIDLFQGIFLLAVILFVPFFVMNHFGGSAPFIAAVHEQGKSFSLIPSHGPLSIWKSLLLMLGWGLGYFGQPHILTKFMGIKDPKQIKQSRKIGMSWQFLSLVAATFVGFVGIAALGDTLTNPEQVFILLVRNYFPPFLSGLFLCAIIAAIINATGSMLLVLSTTVTEDFYKRFINKECTEKKQLQVTRISSALAALVAMCVALAHFATIDQLVLYAWSGLGASFGPLLIASLYKEKLSSRSAFLGMLVGGGLVILWPLLGLTNIPSLVVAFPTALLTIFATSKQEVLIEEKT